MKRRHLIPTAVVIVVGIIVVVGCGNRDKAKTVVNGEPERAKTVAEPAADDTKTAKKTEDVEFTA